MAILCCLNKQIIVGVNTKLIKFDLESDQYEVIDLPPPLKPATKTSSEETESKELSEKTTDEITNEVIMIRKSDDSKLIAVATTHKQIIVYDVNNEDKFEFRFHTSVTRIPSALKFIPDTSGLLVADKTGDCYRILLDNVDRKPEWILGHISMVLDLLITDDGRYIITCDRDEKIKVTRYPKTYIIENYCLGHTEYVSSIGFIPHQKSNLLSVSGDAKIKLWNFIEGTELKEISLPSNGYKLTLAQVDQTASICAILLANFEQLLIYKITSSTSDAHQIDLIAQQEFSEKQQMITSITFGDTYEQLFLHLVNTNTSKHEVIRLNYNDPQHDKNYMVLHCENKITDAVNKNFDDLTAKLSMIDEMSLLFKKKFDNVKEYQDRKRKRIEGKNE